MGSASINAAKTYPPGVHVPSLTWFTGTTEQEIDWALQKQHLEFLVKSGLHGIVLAGTNGEAVTLNAKEKRELVRLTRQIAIDADRPHLPITLGCGGQRTSDVIAETKFGAEEGADFALVLVPSFFHFAMTEEAIISFFQELADASPIPIVIYNFPSVAAGLDVNSDMLSILGKHPNIVGVKLTCGGIAKVARIRASFEPAQFSALSGQSDWLIPAMAVGGTGVTTGVANLFPKIYDLYMAGKLEQAQAAQLKLAQMEWGLAKGGINGTKWVAAKILGYPMETCHCRRPYPQYADAKKQSWILHTCSTLIDDEKRLSMS